MSTNEGDPPPRWLFLLELGYVGLLVAAGIGYGHIAWLKRLVPSTVGPIPLSVPWWGALGGVTISLTGIFRHPADWRRSYNNWHVARPILGAVMGSVGFLIFVAVIRSTGTRAETSSAMGSAVYDLVAFLLGYREEVFRELLRKAVDILLAPGRGTQGGNTKSNGE